MGKIIRKFSYIIFGNLIIFLGIGHILDLILDEKIKYKIIFLILSIISLLFLSIKFFKKSLVDINNLSNIKENKNNKNDGK